MLWVLIRRPHIYFHGEVRQTSIFLVENCALAGAMLKQKLLLRAVSL